MGWRAVCECGWRGGRRPREEAAAYDRRVHEHVHALVDEAPPLSPAQLAKVRILLYGVTTKIARPAARE